MGVPNHRTEDIIPTREAAQILGITQEGVTDLLRRGTLKGQKFGPIWAVDKTSVLEYKVEREKRLAQRKQSNQSQ